MYRHVSFLVLCTMLATLAWPTTPTLAASTSTSTAAPTPGDGFAFFPETGHNIGLAIKRFYDAHGGLDIFGLPLTEVFEEDGLQVQYFERARFELHPELPEAFYVSLTLIGQHFTEGRSDPAFQWISANPDDSHVFFPESGHSLGGAFRYFWEGRGGLAAFGYPISEEFTEINAQDGKPYTVQYFQRARFQYNPDKVGTPYEVELGQLGRQLLDEHPELQAYTAPVQPMVLLGKATTGFLASAAEREFNIARATKIFDGVIVQPGQEYSFSSASDFSEANGFIDGYAIVGGKLEKVVGGGLCQVATTMFRAVSNAGLQITRRTGHTYVVNFYENILGFDATVFTPSVDFRWRNDSPGPVVLVTSANLSAATVTFEVWGTSDGRTVSYQGPFTKNVVEPGKATWQYDKTLRTGAKQQLVHGRPGMDVTYIRTVKLSDGTVKRVDNFYTHYLPWNDFYIYGPGVTPPADAIIISPRTN